MPTLKFLNSIVFKACFIENRIEPAKDTLYVDVFEMMSTTYLFENAETETKAPYFHLYKLNITSYVVWTPSPLLHFSTISAKNCKEWSSWSIVTDVNICRVGFINFEFL